MQQTLIPREVEMLKILRNVGFESIWGLLANCPLRSLKKGEILFKAGQPNKTMYMILSGKLSVHLQDINDTPAAFLEAGHTVGEISVIDNQPVSANVIADTDVRLLEVDEKTFWRLIDVSHDFARNMLVLFVERMRANNFALSESTFQKKQLEKVAMADGLTGLLNRRWLDENLPRFISRYQFSNKPLSILMIDIDHFKKFNDTYGHVAGDRALMHIAKLFVAGVRPTDFCSRYGGEEFVVILSDTDLTNACSAAERLREHIAVSPMAVNGGKFNFTISIGIAVLGKTEDMASLISRADACLYRAKHEGRNMVVWEE